jgi:hypothetical protein
LNVAHVDFEGEHTQQHRECSATTDVVIQDPL